MYNCKISFCCKGGCSPGKLEHKACHGWAFGQLWERARAFLPTTDQLINLIQYQNGGSALAGFQGRCGPERLSILHAMIQNSLNVQQLGVLQQ